MTTQSKSCITTSLTQADRIVAQLMAADFSAEEISVLIPSETGPAPGSESTNRMNGTGDPEREGRDRKARNVLISVHLEAGRRMGRAEEIFCRADTEARSPTRLEDESPQSWVNTQLRKTR